MTICWRQRIASAAIACLLLAVGQVGANGVDPTVVAGQASFSAQGNSLEITNSPGTVINWQGFSIGAGESTRFIQQNAASSVLNRVVGSDPSTLLGTLTSNGRVFLINPSGIVVGEGARIDVAGLVASTLNLSNEDFAAGRLDFVPDPFAGTVENRGSIVTPSGGSVYLVGPNVGNSGSIDSPRGEIILAAGQSARIFDSSTPGVRVEVTGSDNLAVNLGEILAKSGEIGIYAAAFRNAGIVNADQVVRDAGGKIVLRAARDITLEAGSDISATGEQGGTIAVQSETGTTLVSGRIDASSTGAGQTGGSVTVLGDKVGLVGGHIDASGDAGGGTVLVGGDLYGANPDVRNATATYMSADATITADAVTDGNGGTVVLWADGSTRAYGGISARGGAYGGNGGLIETSGGWLDVAGIDVDASGPKGTAGTWLLDPNNITIQSGGTDTNVTASPNFTSTDDDAIVSTESIQTALNAGTSVIVATGTGGANTQEGDITVADTLTWTHASGPTLTLDAFRDVVVNADVTVTTGSFLAQAGRNVNLNAAMTVTTGNITAIAGGDVNVAAAMTVTTGDIVLYGDNDGTGPGAVVGGTVNVGCGSNCLTITTGTLRIRFNPESYATTDAEIAAYDANLTGGGILDAKAWVFGLGDDRLYDGTTVATVSGLEPDVLGGAPDASLGTVTNANFDTKHVGTDKLITYDSDFSDSVHELFAPFGTPVGTYTTRADILVRPLAVDAVTDTRVYDATTNSAGTPTVTGLQTGDSLNGALTQSFASKDVLGLDNSTLVADGTYSVSDGNGGNNYAITVNTATGTITPLAITGDITADDKVYDATDAADILTRTLTGVLASDDVTYVGGTALFEDKNVGIDKTVTGTSLSLAGADAGNYTVNTTALTTADITPLVITGDITADDKIYDATDAAAILTRTLTGVLGSDDVTYVGGTALFDDKNVGTDKTVTGTSLSLDGADAGNYTVNTTALTTADITPLAITGDITADDKVYDATDAAAILTRTLTGVLASDDVTYVGGTALFDDKNVGTDKTVTGTSLSLSGTDAGNYTVNTTTETLADITPLAITGDITADDKIYDATTTADILTRTLTGVLGSDDVTYVGGTALFDDKNVGTDKTVTGTSLSLDGADAGNYTVNSTALTTADITPLAITGDITAADKIYDATTAADILTRTLTGVLGTDDVTYVGGTAVFDDKNVGTDKTVTGTSLSLAGTDAGNYTVNTTALTTAEITPLAITGDITADDKIYDATDAADILTRTLTGVLGTDDVTYVGGTALFDDKNVGNDKTVTGTSLSLAGTDAGNYTVNTTAETLADIDPLAVTLTAPNVTKIYDGGLLYTTQATDLTALAAPLLGDDTVTAATIDYLDRNVGDGDKTVDLNAATISDGNSGNNYVVTLAGNSTSTITARPLTVTAASDTKTYDTTISSAAAPIHEALQAGDTTTTFAQTFDDPNAGTGKTLTATGAVNDGNGGNNYAVTFVNDNTGVIDPLAITGDITADDKIYDATKTADILTRTLTGVLAGDDVTYVGGTAVFEDKNAGIDKIVIGTSLSLAGADAGNYTVNTAALATADITPLAISGAITADDKIYDATTTADILTRTLTGVLAGDDVTYVGGTAVFDDKNAGTGKTVTGTSLGLAGADAGNYSVNSTALATADIDQAPLDVVAQPKSKIFGTNDPPLTFSVTGLVSNPELGIDETEDLVLSGALTRAPGESVLDGPYAITRGTLTSNDNYTIDFTGSLLVIVGAAEEPVLGFDVGQFLFAEVNNNVSYYRPGNFWHISLNPNNADPGFDVMRGTEELRSRANQCDSVSGAGYCETWSFPQQTGEAGGLE